MSNTQSPARQTRIELIARAIIVGALEFVPADATEREIEDGVALANKLRLEELQRALERARRNP
jgi:hypothetical protein